MNCKFCGKVCKSKPSLLNHERLCKLNPEPQTPNMTKAREAATRKIECPFCQKMVSVCGMNQHKLYCLENPDGKGVKICPVCKKKFRSTAVTCSYGCSNTHFRSGSDHPNWKEESYRTTCFDSHEKKCVICGEDKIVAVHHFDENRENNSPENLIPLCPTHHQYWHSRYRYLIEEQVIKYIKDFGV